MGAFVTGTQMGDVTALTAARHALLHKMGWDVEGDGLFGAPPVSVIVGEEVYVTMLKALAMVGFGRNRIHVVPADSQGRMKPSEIPRLPGPVILCAQLGNVNTGACDPVGDVCDEAHHMDAWGPHRWGLRAVGGSGGAKQMPSGRIVGKQEVIRAPTGRQSFSIDDIPISLIEGI